MRNPATTLLALALILGLEAGSLPVQAARKRKTPPPPPTAEELFAAFSSQWKSSPLAFHLQLIDLTCPGPEEERAACENHLGEVIAFPEGRNPGSGPALQFLLEKFAAKKAALAPCFLVPATGGETLFQAGFWLQKKPVKLRLTAAAPPPGEKKYPLRLEMLPFKPGAPFGQGQLFPARNQATGLVASSPKAGHLTVIAVTPLDPWDEEVRLRQAGPVEWVKPPVEEPKLVKKATPEAPEKGIDRPDRCTVRLGAIVDTAGHPAVIRLLSAPPGCEAAAAAAYQAFREWRFEPARRDGQEVAVYHAAAFDLEQ